ncbi:hypothetical protein M8J76_008153 [Diaphorina citri]|nr:hypothetical protein M8J76_008153 [Diaphorina citri]
MTTFTPEEVEMLKSRGNDYCRRVWLGLCDNSIQYKDEQQIKDFMIDKYEKKRYYIDPSTIPNLKPSTAQSTSQPPVTSTTQQSSQVVHPKSIPLRTTQITLTNGSAHPSSTSSTSSSTSTLPPPSSQSSLFQADFKLAPKDPFASSNGTSVPRNSRGQQSQPQPAAQQQPSFANFDNAVFSSVQQAPPYTQMKTSSSCHLDMFSDLLMSSYKPSLHNTSSFSSNLNRWIDEAENIQHQ